ncbi:MAG TPA: GNAT family N-acetyltransferase [Clostridia bacterium]|nr:GNAT family N-acetyltransferase [Clostridia bacterium]
MVRSEYFTERLCMTLSHPRLAPLVAEYFLRNREFLRATEPERDEEFFTKSCQRSFLQADVERFSDGTAVKFWLSYRGEARIIGMLSLSTIVMGAFRSCFVGYRLDKDEINKGLMTEALFKAVDIAFHDIGLHRLEANIMPRNKPSLRVAEKAGFIDEGISKKYLQIDGVWEDHIHMVLLNEEMEERWK